MGRSKDMNARECIGTGFDGTWVMGRKLSAEEDKSVLEIIATIGPPSDPDFAHRPFATLPPSQQSLVLLMRALVGRKELVVLDEPVGMAKDSIKAYLRGEGGGIGQDKAVVVVSHWDDEVPWTVHEGLRVFRLENGRGWEA
jgi:ABC-type molybdenum transport system ATPase subunit/photorepair protein PhrA